MSTLFFSYSHKDEGLRDELETHLAMLKRQGVISTWHDRRLKAGEDVSSGISAEIERAATILLLVSPDFLASEYCYSLEMTRAIERHQAGEARVIPVILRPCDWHSAPFGNLLAAPKDGKPVTKWPDRDEAFLDVAVMIRSAMAPEPLIPHIPTAAPSTPDTAIRSSEREPRSSNLRMKRDFTQLDKDRFQDEAFEFIARFFENSLTELRERNSGIEASFKRVDAGKFTAAIYRNGEAQARCQVRLGTGWSYGITYAAGNLSDNSFNESLTVEVGDQSLALKALGMQFGRGQSGGHLSFEGAAEYYWSLFIEPLQR